MTELPKTIDARIAITLTNLGELYPVTIPLKGSPEDYLPKDWVLLGTKDLTLDVPQVNQVNLVEKHLKALDQQEQILRSKFSEELDGIHNRRAELLALTYQPTVVA